MKKTYKFLFLLVGIFSATLLQAQTNSYIFYNEQQNIVNPAAVGTETGHSVLLNLRSQWFQGASSSDNPQIQTLNTTHRITDRIGLGVSIVNDRRAQRKGKAVSPDRRRLGRRLSAAFAPVTATCQSRMSSLLFPFFSADQTLKVPKNWPPYEPSPFGSVLCSKVGRLTPRPVIDK